jgi:hypothetical protein
MNVNNHQDETGGCTCGVCVPSFVALDIEPVLPAKPTTRAQERALVQKAQADAKFSAPVLRRIGPFVLEDRTVLAGN